MIGIGVSLFLRIMRAPFLMLGAGVLSRIESDGFRGYHLECDGSLVTCILCTVW